MELKEILQQMVDNKASDIFIVAGLQLTYKKGGQQYRTDSERLMPSDTFDLVRQIYEISGRDFKHFIDNDQHDDDFSFSIPGMGRFRANAFRQRGSASAVIRVIPFGLPDPVDNNIPEEVLTLCRFQKGLVLVTGSAGAGKSTTLACIVTQREIPTDVATYSEALRSAIRESPDVILLGEMRDQDTIATAVTAAEMSQLIFSTMHTSSASTTVDRIVDSFPSAQQRQIRMQLSLVLRAVVSQQLVPTKDGHVVPAFEIMVANTAIRNLIREEKTYQIDSVIASAGKHGMRTMDQSLFTLVQDGIVDSEVALQHAIHPEAFRNRLKTMGL